MRPAGRVERRRSGSTRSGSRITSSTPSRGTVPIRRRSRRWSRSRRSPASPPSPTGSGSERSSCAPPSGIPRCSRRQRRRSICSQAVDSISDSGPDGWRKSSRRSDTGSAHRGSGSRCWRRPSRCCKKLFGGEPVTHDGPTVTLREAVLAPGARPPAAPVGGREGRPAAPPTGGSSGGRMEHGVADLARGLRVEGVGRAGSLRGRGP